MLSESIAKSSGSPELDAAAMDIMRRALPFKMPDGSTGGHFVVPIAFHMASQPN
jgi:TonB family protein